MTETSGESDFLNTELEPNPEPSREPFDPHMPPLDDDDDARFLDPVDPRRREVEERRGRPFSND